MNPGPENRFLVDHMLIKLGKYLRILGCDAVWDKNSRTHELILRSNLEGRIFLTRNARLQYQYPAAKRVIVIASADPVEQLSVVIKETQIDPRAGFFFKCIRCNVFLDRVPDKKTIESAVHPNVYSRHSSFFKCPVCGAVFWHGSHVVNTCAKLGLGLP